MLNTRISLFFGAFLFLWGVVGFVVSAPSAEAQLGMGLQADMPGDGDLLSGRSVALPAARRRRSTWRWQQINTSPRILGQLAAVSVDPDNPNRIFVGTMENTLLRSLDGGATWREIEVSPYVNPAKEVKVKAPGLPDLGENLNKGMTFFVDPPYQRRPVDRVLLEFDTDFLSVKPPYWSIGFKPYEPPVKKTFLKDSIRRQPTFSVRRFAICPGAEFPLVVATWTEILGSQDDGLTWVRLFRIAGSDMSIRHVECNPNNPNDLLAATGYGIFYSHDGGASWDQSMTGWPGRLSAAVAFDRSEEGRVYASSKHWLYGGEIGTDRGLQRIYPDFEGDTAPWEVINWVETMAGALWLATDDGIRISYDGGRTWDPQSPLLFSHMVIRQITAGYNDEGRRRIAVIERDCPLQKKFGYLVAGRQLCRNSEVYATDDDGDTWFLFFNGITRRQAFQMAAAPAIPGTPPRWWIVAGNELWATVPPNYHDEGEVDFESAAWAVDKLRRNPTLTDVTNAAFEGTRVLPKKYLDMFDILKDRDYYPVVHSRFTHTVTDYGDSGLQTPVNAFTSETVSRTLNTEFFTYGQWRFNGIPFTFREVGNDRRSLYKIRYNIQFSIEDAWHERVLLLSRIGRGMTDRFQIEVYKARIAALETVMEIWGRKSMDSYVPDPREGRQYVL